MDKKYKIKTLIRWDHKLGDDAYVRGRITGFQCALCNQYKEFANVRIKEGVVLTAECTATQYDDFINVVERHYPGLCKFDYKESE